MKLGFCSAILPDLPLDEVLTLAAREDYECVEVMCWPVSKAERRYAGITHIDVVDFGSAQVTQVKEQVAASGIDISALGYYPNPLTPDQREADQAVEHIMNVILAAEMLEIGRVNTFVGRDWTKSVDENWPRFLATWKPLIQFAEDHGVLVGIENCPMLFSSDEWPGGKNLAATPAIWRRMFNDIDSPNFGLNYDPSHLVWQQMDYIAPLREFQDRIFHAHAKDVRVDRHLLNDVGILATPLEYHSPKIPGMGEIDWGRFCSVLTDTGYGGAICVEVEDRAFEGSLKDRKRALHQSRVFLRNFIA
jgi:sugar phosphate isomerase/epimerase